MAVAVIPQLDRLLRDRDVSLAALRLMIEERYGLAVDLAELEALARPESVGWADLRLAAAVATVLNARLDDLFSIEETPDDGGWISKDEAAANEASRRLLELLAAEDEGKLDESGRREIEAQIDTYGRAIRALHLRRYAAKRDLSFEEAVEEADRDLAQALARIHRLENDPDERQRLVMLARQRRVSMPR